MPLLTKEESKKLEERIYYRYSHVENIKVRDRKYFIVYFTGEKKVCGLIGYMEAFNFEVLAVDFENRIVKFRKEME